jgi:hypothetical protein
MPVLASGIESMEAIRASALLGWVFARREKKRRSVVLHPHAGPGGL